MTDTEPKLPSYLRQDDHDGTLMIKIFGAVAVVVLLLGGILFWVGDNQNSQTANDLYAKASDDFTNSNLSSSLSEVEQALALKQKPEYYRLKLNILMNQNKPDQSKQVLDKLIAMEPGNAQYYFLLHGLAKNDDDTDTALKDIDKAIELAPTNSDYQIAKATLLVENNRRTEAVPIYESLIKTEPQNYYFWDQYALSYSNYQQYKPALDIRKRGLAAAPGDAMQYFGIGQLYDSMGQKQDAISNYYRFLQMHPMQDSIAASRIFDLTGKHVPPELENITSNTVPLEKANKAMYLTVNINGQTGHFLLDTGAQISAVRSGKSGFFQLQTVPHVVHLETAGGSTQVPLAYGNIRIGKYDLNNVRFALLGSLKDPSVDGIIGMNVLDEFQYEIDGNKLVLKR